MWWNQVEGPGSVLLAWGGILEQFDSPAFICGLWKSEDEGTTWRRLTTATEIDTCRTEVSLALDLHGNALMSVSKRFSFPPPLPLLYKSTDAGESWELAEDPDSASTIGVRYLGNQLGGN